MTEPHRLRLHYHPFSRAANVVWMLEELGKPYSLEFVDLKTGEQSNSDLRQINPMGKLPTLVDGSTVVTESAAIAMYLADRYAHGELCPRIDEPERGTYLRWICFSPAVIEPCAYAHGAKWDYRPAQAGWGTYENMHDAVEAAIGDGPYILGERFSMADVVLGGTVGYLLRFEMLDTRPAFQRYVEQLATRPASQRARAKNAAMVEEHQLA